MILRIEPWHVGMLTVGLDLGDLRLLDLFLDGLEMPRENEDCAGYTFCRWRWINRWRELAANRWPLDQDVKRKAIVEFAEDAAAWNSDSQLAVMQRKHHAPKCPSGTNA